MSPAIDIYAIAARLEIEAEEAWHATLRDPDWTIPPEFQAMLDARAARHAAQELAAEIKARLPTSMEVREQMLRERYGVYYDREGEL